MKHGELTSDDIGSLRRLVDLSLELGRNQDVGKVLQAVADAVLELLDADRAFVILAGTHVVASAYGPGQSGAPSLSVAGFALSQGKEVVTADISEHELSAAHSVMNLQLRAVLCTPLYDGDDVIGALYADSARRGHDELRGLVWLARAYAAHASVALKNARTLASARRRSRHAREAAHDIRNLVSGIELGLDELSELELPAWASEVLSDVRRMNGVALTTATTALTEQRREPVSVALHDLVITGVGLLRFEARKQGVELGCTVEELHVEGVANDLARVLANLLGNALKYTPRGGRISVGLERVPEGARLTVADEGPGIAADALESVFRTGFQGPDAAPGHGLGLGICRAIVKQHGGVVRARNSEHGAVLEVLLPALPSA